MSKFSNWPKIESNWDFSQFIYLCTNQNTMLPLNNDNDTNDMVLNTVFEWTCPVILTNKLCEVITTIISLLKSQGYVAYHKCFTC